MPRGNPHPHRYKYGKISKPIDLQIFNALQGRVDNRSHVNQAGEMHHRKNDKVDGLERK